ncbi:MAG: glycosyltransferase family 4 protein [Kiloniellaceae bacterium]
MKIAIVHDWLVTYAGAERVLEQMLLCYPAADLFAPIDFLDEAERGFLQGKRPHTSFVQRLPFARRNYRLYLPAMAFAVEQFDLSAYDVVISSSHSVAKGVLTGPDQLHISYVYTPMRYAWDLQHQYLQEAGLSRGARGLAARWMLHRMRLWDSRTAHGVDRYIGISHYIARRIGKAYGRDAAVIHPPVDVSYFAPCESKEDFYLTASRLVPYKKVGAVVEAFARLPDRRLIVIGEGPERRRLQHGATPNVDFLGRQPAELLRDHMQRARAFVFAAEEDFGIAPLEAQACGTPVIAYGKGGVRETIRGLDQAPPTGLFFDRQTPEAIAAAIRAFEARGDCFAARDCRANAERFAPDRFRAEFTDFVEQARRDWLADLAAGRAHPCRPRQVGRPQGALSASRTAPACRGAGAPRRRLTGR